VDTEQLDLLAHAAALRDEGIARADSTVHDDWRQQVDLAIVQLAASGRRFTADDVRALGIDDPASPRAWGARFLGAARAGLIVRVGYRPSTRASVHAHPIAEWQGAAAAERSAA
jgi:hypothetical protein